ncbi:unnamed protein product [Boreogadus saida]
MRTGAGGANCTQQGEDRTAEEPEPTGGNRDKPGRTGRNQDKPGGTGRNREEPGGTGGNQEEPGGTGENREEPRGTHREGSGSGRLDVSKAHYCPYRPQIEVWIAQKSRETDF